MRFELKIAWRYLFAKKSHNAINIVSGVSAAGVCVSTAALVCVLSVMNGFNRVIEQLFSAFDPELLIQPTEGKYFSLDTDAMEQVAAMPEVAVFSPIVEETAMVEYKDHQVPARIMGVSDNFSTLTQIDSIITDGEFMVWDGGFDRCVMGRGLASTIGINAHFVGGVRLYAPKRTAKINVMRPDQALNKEVTYIAGTFAVNQLDYDDHLCLVSIACARRLFEYADKEATAVAIRLSDDCSKKAVKKQISDALGKDFSVRDRYEQQADFFRIALMEKLLCTLLLAFILMIASFNIIGSLSMLMLEKQDDMQGFRHLGACPKQVRRIFLFEGWMISALGALCGLVIGLALCLLQQEYGFLKLGNGYEYVLWAYPVAVEPMDIAVIAVIVLVMGFAAAWYPTRNIMRNED